MTRYRSIPCSTAHETVRSRASSVMTSISTMNLSVAPLHALCHAYLDELMPSDLKPATLRRPSSSYAPTLIHEREIEMPVECYS